MSDFKEKLKMFNAQPPPLKPKPFRTISESNLKVNTDEPKKVEPQKVVNEFDFEDCVSSTVDVSIPTESLVSVRLSRGSESTEEFTEYDSYSIFDSIYDLPGLEHFLSDDKPTSDQPNAPETPAIKTDTSDETYCDDDSSLNISDQPKSQDENLLSPNMSEDTKNDHITMAPSPKLIEEIFNTSLWRDSNNFSDDFIFAPSENISIVRPNSIVLSHQDLDDNKKSQIGGRRSIFSSIFRSKKGTKKSSDKSSVMDNSDSESFKESLDKCKTNNKKHIEEDDKSLDNTPKKPLNAIFNRDWLNNIGDGIKKKASVMSEIRKVFSHGKFKHFKKKVSKNSPEVNIEKEDDMYDDGSDGSLSQNSIQIQPQNKYNIVDINLRVEKVNKNADININMESIYDNEEEEEEEEKLENNTEKCKISSMVKINQQIIYDEEHDLKEIYASDEEDQTTDFIISTVINKAISAVESIYDNRYQYEERETSQVNESYIKHNMKSMIKPKEKTIIEENRNNAYENIFGKKLPNLSEKNKKIYERNDIDKRMNDTLIKKKDTFSECETFDINDSFKENHCDIDDVENITEEIKNRTDNIPSKKIDNVLFKQSELYDEDDAFVEEYVTDVDNLPSIKEIIKESLNTSKKVGATTKNKNNTNNIIFNNQISELEIYDEDAEEEKEFTSEKNIPLNNKVDNKIKQDVKKTKKMKKSNEITSKSLSNVKKNKSKMFSKMVLKPLPIYDEDDKLVEEYISEVDCTESIEEEKCGKKTVIKKEKKEKPKKGSQKKTESKSKIKCKNENVQAISPTIKYLYDEDEDVAEIYISEEDTKIAFVNNKNTKVESHKIYLEDIKKQNKEISNFTFEGKKNIVNIVKQTSDKDDDQGIYDDDDTVNIEENSEFNESKEENEERQRTNESEVNTKSSFMMKIGAGIKRRKRNMIINFKNTSFLGNKGTKPKLSQNITLEGNTNIDTTKDTVSVKKDREDAAETDEEMLKKVRIKNMEMAKKIFKLKEPIQSIGTVRAIKTVYMDNNTYMKFNMGEFLDILEYRKDMALVRNGFFKCGLTSLSNIQVIETSP